MAAVYLFLKYQFYGYLIVDRGLGPIEALQQSGRLTEGVLKNLLIFWVEIGLAIGVALAMVSIFIEIPVAIILGLISEDLAPHGRKPCLFCHQTAYNRAHHQAGHRGHLPAAGGEITSSGST